MGQVTMFGLHQHSAGAVAGGARLHQLQEAVRLLNRCFGKVGRAESGRKKGWDDQEREQERRNGRKDTAAATSADASSPAISAMPPCATHSNRAPAANSRNRWERSPTTINAILNLHDKPLFNKRSSMPHCFTGYCSSAFIGYVGSTVFRPGLTSIFEMTKNGRPTNPSSVKLDDGPGHLEGASQTAAGAGRNSRSLASASRRFSATLS